MIKYRSKYNSWEFFMDNYGYYPDDDEVKVKGFTIGKLFKYVGIAIVIAVWVLLIVRIWTAEDTKFSKSFMWTDASINAYKADPKGFVIKSYDLHSYDYLIENSDGTYDSERITRNNMTDDGYFQVTNLMYVPATKELQFTVRYTSKSVEYLETYYNLSSKPTGIPYHFMVYEGDKYFDDYTYTTDTRFVYTYCRVVFSNIDIEDFNIMSLGVFYENLADYDYPYSSLVIYDSYLDMKNYSVKKALPAELGDDIRVSENIPIKNLPLENKDDENEN